MDCAVVCVPGRPLAAEGSKTGGQTHESYRDADPRNNIDQKFFYSDSGLLKRDRKEQADV